jgi:tripartite-type tricarboxylate transporter receptor subunit TctC
LLETYTSVFSAGNKGPYESAAIEGCALNERNDMNVFRYCYGMAAALFLALAAAPTAHAQADDYPAKAVTIISDAPPGSAPDVDARFIADGLGKMWGRQVVVIEHAGAYGSIAARAAAETAPDGYTLYMPSLASFVAPAKAAPNVPLRLPRDFLPIGFTAENPMFVAVNPTLGVNTLPELIALSKKDPSSISIAVTGVGRLTDLTGRVLERREGVDFVRVPYNSGPAAAIADVASGRVSMIIEGYSGIVGAIKGHQIKVIAVASAKRLPEFPDVPTVSETIPDFSATGWQVLLAPLHTPAPIVSKVSADLSKLVSDPEFQKRLATVGSYSHAMTPEQVLAFVQKEQNTWLPVLQNTSGR